MWRCLPVAAQVGQRAAGRQQADEGLGAGRGGAAQGQVEAAVLEAQGGDAVGGVGAQGLGGLGQQGQGVVIAEQAMAGAFGVQLLPHLGGRGDHRCIGEGAAKDPFDTRFETAQNMSLPQHLTHIGGQPEAQCSHRQQGGGAQSADPRRTLVSAGELAVEQVGGLALVSLPPQVGRGGAQTQATFGGRGSEVESRAPRGGMQVDLGRGRVGRPGAGGLRGQQRNQDVPVKGQPGPRVGAQDGALGGQAEMPAGVVGRGGLQLGHDPAG